MRGSWAEAIFVFILLVFLYLAFALAGRIVGHTSEQDFKDVGWEYSTEGELNGSP